jgi:hypothetical protein
MKYNHSPYYDADYVQRTPDIFHNSHDGTKYVLDLVFGFFVLYLYIFIL